MFPVACTHCILATKFAHSFCWVCVGEGCVCIKNHLSGKEKHKYQKKQKQKHQKFKKKKHLQNNFFGLNMLKSSVMFMCYVYVVNQIFVSASDLLQNKYQKR